MDSLTQAALGATVAAAAAPEGHRRKALLIGAGLGTLPDLDVFIDYGDAVRNFTFHRGFSHSLLVLLPLSLVIWWGVCRSWATARATPGRWLAVIALALVTHPLLDAHTVYGTQLLWPLATPPVMWATVFIIDPVFTLPLLIAAGVIAVRPQRSWSGAVLHGALALSLAYLGWSWFAQAQVRHQALEALAYRQIEILEREAWGREAPALLVTPAPFTTMRWRVLAMGDDRYYEAFASPFAAAIDLRFSSYPLDPGLLEETSELWSVRRLAWFAQGFIRPEVREGSLQIVDLRMGQEPYYVFTHRVAVRDGDDWKAATTRLLPVAYDRNQVLNALRQGWSRGAPEPEEGSVTGQ